MYPVCRVYPISIPYCYSYWLGALSKQCPYSQQKDSTLASRVNMPLRKYMQAASFQRGKQILVPLFRTFLHYLTLIAGIHLLGKIIIFTKS